MNNGVSFDPRGPLALIADMFTILGSHYQIATCGTCGQKNKITREQLRDGRRPHCGSCGLPFSGCLAAKGRA